MERSLPPRPLTREEIEAVVRDVERAYEDGGPPPRTTLEILDNEAVPRIRVSGLFIECAVCGTRQPQSRTRQSPDARRLWVAMHLACAGEDG